jgi:Zn-dependent protease
MGYQDRSYYRDSGSGSSNPLMWLIAGSMPLFTAFGIRVRAHASMVLFIGLVLLFGLGDEGFAWEDRIQSMSMLFLIVLLHEFGHCFAARWVGGEANDILMHPLGGLALTQPPHRWVPTFITVAAGPSVNLLICLVCGTFLWFSIGWLPWGFGHFVPPHDLTASMLSALRWPFWIYQISLMLLLFNLLPIFPLDGGQMLQALLWPAVGYYKSMLFSCTAGMVGAILLFAYGIVKFELFLVLLAASGFFYCIQLRRALVSAGPEEYSDTTDYSAAYEQPERPRRPSRWAAKRALKLAHAERRERIMVDQILAKVSAHGMHSLTWMERRTLKRATEQQRRRDAEMSRLKRL